MVVAAGHCRVTGVARSPRSFAQRHPANMRVGQRQIVPGSVDVVHGNAAQPACPPQQRAIDDDVVGADNKSYHYVCIGQCPQRVRPGLVEHNGVHRLAIRRPLCSTPRRAAGTGSRGLAATATMDAVPRKRHIAAHAARASGVSNASSRDSAEPGDPVASVGRAPVQRCAPGDDPVDRSSVREQLLRQVQAATTPPML